jgi:hypothetical protein
MLATERATPTLPALLHCQAGFSSFGSIRIGHGFGEDLGHFSSISVGLQFFTQFLPIATLELASSAAAGFMVHQARLIGEDFLDL